MKKEKWAIPLIAFTLAGGCLGASVAFATGGQSDPLVSLSYLNQTTLPAIISQIETKATQQQKDMTAQFTADLAKQKTEISQMVGSASGSGGGSTQATYAVVTLSQGQQLKMEVGCEVMLRVGTATVVSGTSPGLIDVATAGERNNGLGLEKNHLYMATIPDRSVKATAATVKVLVRGSYTIV